LRPPADLPGWWAKLCLFSLGEPLPYIDPDSVVGAIGRNAAGNDQADAAFGPLGVEARGPAPLCLRLLGPSLLVPTPQVCKANLQAAVWFC
jgi:hypothetical protein